MLKATTWRTRPSSSVEAVSDTVAPIDSPARMTSVRPKVVTKSTIARRSAGSVYTAPGAMSDQPIPGRSIA
jgi:hypothetical protein